ADAFSACAMLFGDSSFVGALFLSTVIAIGAMAVATIIQRNMNVFNYIVIFVVIMAMFSVKTSVYIASYYDLGSDGRVKGGVIGAEVANVPVGVAIPLGVMSSIGKTITDKFDTALNSPSSEVSFLIQGSEGYFSPLKTMLKLRNQWNSPENQYLLDNISVVMRKNGGCGWNDGAEKLGKQGIYGLFINSNPSGTTVPIIIPEIDANGNIKNKTPYLVDCPLAGTIINAQMLRNVSALGNGKQYSHLAENMAQKRNLALTASGTKDSSKYSERVSATQGEMDRVPNLVIKNLQATNGNNVAITITQIDTFLEQVRQMALQQNGVNKEVTYQEVLPHIPSTMIVGNIEGLDRINSAEIQANMIYGNLLLNCLSNDVTCAKSENAMIDAISKANIDSAGQASMYAHYMHYGMNILLFIYVVMSPLMIIVIMAMGMQGWKLIKSYLLFAVWINSWLPASIAIAYYQLRGFETSVGNLVKSLTNSPEMVYSPVVMNNLLNGAADSIASASNMMASVPLLMMALLSGSVYGLTHLAQKAAMSHKDYVNEGAITQSPNDAQSYNGQIAQAMLQATGGNATSANAERMVLGTRQGDHVNFQLSSNMQETENAKSAISSQISALDNISNTQTWGEVDSQSKTIQDGGIHITQTSDGQQQVSFGTDAAHALASGQGFSLGVSGEKVVAVGANGQISENVSVKHADGTSEVLTTKMSLQTGDSIVTDFGTVKSSAITSSAQQALSHQESQLAAIETAQSHSTGGGISVNFDNELYNHVVSAPNAMDIKHDALSNAGKYNTDFEQQIMRAGNYANELQIAKDALQSNDMSKVQAAGAYLSTMFAESGINGGESIAEQVKGYVATKTGNFEEQVRQEINSDISARNAAERFNFADNSVSQQGEMIRHNIESGETKVGYDKGEEQNALKHGGYTIDQRKIMHEENMAAMKKDGDRIMNALEEYGQRSGLEKFWDWGWQDARSHWEAVKDNMDMAQDAWDEGRYGDFAKHNVATSVGVALTPIKYGLGPVLQLIGDFENGTHSSQNNLGVHDVTDPELQKLIDDAVKLDEKMREYGANPENLDTKPYNDEVAEKVGAPKYAPVDSGQPEQPIATEHKSGLDPATEFFATLTGSSVAHADTMPLRPTQHNLSPESLPSDHLPDGVERTAYRDISANAATGTPVQETDLEKTAGNQADKDSSGSLNDEKQAEQANAEPQKTEDEQLLKEQARDEENEQQTQADKAEQERRLAEQKAEEAAKKAAEAEKARLEQLKKEEENKPKNSTITTTTDKDGNTQTTISLVDRNKPLDKVPDSWKTDAPWLVDANGEVGTREIDDKHHKDKIKELGMTDNPEVLKYFDTIKGLSKAHKSKDETAWCSALVNYVLTQAGIKGTNSAGSQSWKDTSQWDGKKLDQPAVGSIAVYQNIGKNGKPTGTGHVAFVAGQDENGKLVVLGGNQWDGIEKIKKPNGKFDYPGRNVNYASRNDKQGSSVLVGFYHPKNFEPNYNLPTIKMGKNSADKGGNR
ncbi:MAG: TIGR02594 family protein, partial [Neisseriaceae bacterium]|nr:TIGR02594 family protein [Neisseriaceae bacterium]